MGLVLRLVREVRVCLHVSACVSQLPTVYGIGVFFYTRKGYFLYKISSYIIIYHEYIIVYHVYHHLVSHISCPSSTHDISLVSSFFLRHVISCDLMSRV